MNGSIRSQLFLFGLISLSLSSVAMAQSTSKLPNFFIFIADDLGVLDTTAYGSSDAKTPNVAVLAREGLRFTRAFINSPTCAPSRAALFTALRSQRNGVEPNHDNKRFAAVTHALGKLKALNYEIAAFGKIRHASRKKDKWDHGIDHLGKQRIELQEIEKFLKTRNRSRPLLLMVGSNPPHVPWPKANKVSFDPQRVSLPPRSFDTLQTRIDFTRYLEDIKTMDRMLGETRQLADKYLDLNNTVTLFTSDHGAQWTFAKWNLYDAGTRVPLIVTWPNKIKANTKTAAMVSWIDIFPTLTEIVGKQPDLNRDGRSFKKVLIGQSEKHRDKIFTTHTGGGKNQFPMRAVRTDKWKYILNLYPELYFRTPIDAGPNNPKGKPNSSYFATWEAAAKNVRAAQIAVDTYHMRPAEELYKLDDDPYETNNLVSDPRYRKVLAELRADVERLMQETNDQKLLTGKPVYRSEFRKAKR